MESLKGAVIADFRLKGDAANMDHAWAAYEAVLELEDGRCVQFSAQSTHDGADLDVTVLAPGET